MADRFANAFTDNNNKYHAVVPNDKKMIKNFKYFEIIIKN
jgi:hypothetical protein